MLTCTFPNVVLLAYLDNAMHQLLHKLMTWNSTKIFRLSKDGCIRTLYIYVDYNLILIHPSIPLRSSDHQLQINTNEA